MNAVAPAPADSIELVADTASRIAQAKSLVFAGRSADAEQMLRALIAEVPDCAAPAAALADLLVERGREVEIVAVCATMLSRAPGPPELRLAARLLLQVHLRLAALVERQVEPVRLDFRAIGVADVVPMMLAPGLLKRARQLAQAAVKCMPDDAEALTTLAECELRAGFAGAALKAAERAVGCTPTVAALLARAFAALAQHREARAIALLQQPQLTDKVPELATGRQLALRIDGAFAPGKVATDVARTKWCIPYSVQHAGQAHARSVTVRTGPAESRRIADVRVVGGLFFPIDRKGRAFIHGVVDEPDVAFTVPNYHGVPSLLAERRNTVLLGGETGPLLLHTPGPERACQGRVLMLAHNFSNNYYHWIADVLGRLSAVPEMLADPDARFVIGSPLHAFQVETLAWLGIGADRLVQVGADEIVRFDEVVTVHHRKDGGCTHWDVWRWLRDTLARPAGVRAPWRRLYLRRSGSVMRRLVNERHAEQICAAQGFESVDTSTMTVAAQRDLFAEASIVVSPVGASLTNLLFTPAGARLILFGQRGYVVPCYSAMAEALGHRTRYVLGKEQQSRFPYPHWDYTIDETELHQALDADLGPGDVESRRPDPGA